jgi:hypothetical protein
MLKRDSPLDCNLPEIFIKREEYSFPIRRSLREPYPSIRGSRFGPTACWHLQLAMTCKDILSR